MYFKKFLFAISFGLISLNILADGNEKNLETFEIINLPSGVDATAYIQAVENSNFECYRFESKRRILKFDNGVELILFSAQEINITTGFVSSCFLRDDTKVPNATLSLSNSNTIIMTQTAFDKSNLN